jgi:hypothetical protein
MAMGHWRIGNKWRVFCNVFSVANYNLRPFVSVFIRTWLYLHYFILFFILNLNMCGSLFNWLCTYSLYVLWREENETPGWTQLKLPGQAPSPRCGHSVTNAGHYVITFAQSLFIFLLLLYLRLLLVFYCKKWMFVLFLPHSVIE